MMDLAAAAAKAVELEEDTRVVYLIQEVEKAAAAAAAVKADKVVLAVLVADLPTEFLFLITV